MKIKICGVTDPDDAALAAQLGADYIGIILSPLSKRCVSIAQARDIAAATHAAAATPVVVFVDENANSIIALTDAIGCNTVQLHGDGSRKALPQLIRYFLLIAVNHDEATTPLPGHAIPLFDTPKDEAANTIDWHTLTPPRGKPWALAGGLTPDNVAVAVALLQPPIVDVCSGVEIRGTVRKDPTLVNQFIAEAKGK